ncbi:PD-(D/E)XK nuclease family protein [bacterium]|nr:PD-(D/E)XK nuclease family protein [bacterium]NCT22034.1 PD-(D/E)XK nuclease family protein [bacterium]OIO85348.1 MAG: hypothetical protein AUK01_06405 [Anaerolineae bacterium CG2_30_57_67]
MSDKPASGISISFAFSQASLQAYADCPRRFELRHIERLNYPAVEAEPALENERHRQTGEAFHLLAQQHLLGIPAEQVGRLANSPELAHWWQAWLMFAVGQDFASAQVVSPELMLSAPLTAGFRLTAKFDLLVVRAGRATIFDWKTSKRRTPTPHLAARMQTRVYRAVLAQAGAHFNGGAPFAPENIEMIYWFADFPQDPAHFPYSAAQYQRDWEFLNQRVKTIAATPAGQFPLTADEKACDYCTYRSYCNRGVRAGAESARDLDDNEPNFRLEDVEESAL